MTEEELTDHFSQKRSVLLGYLISLSRNSTVAEDLLQEVWIVAWRNAEAWPTIETPGAWLRGIARNLALHYWRAQKRAPAHLDPELMDLVDLAYQEQESVEDLWQEREKALAECLETLPVRQRAILRLKYEANHTAELIAQKFQMSAESVLMQLSRSRQALRKCVSRRLSDHPK